MLSLPAVIDAFRAAGSHTLCIQRAAHPRLRDRTRGVPRPCRPRRDQVSASIDQPIPPCFRRPYPHTSAAAPIPADARRQNASLSHIVSFSPSFLTHAFSLSPCNRPTGCVKLVFLSVSLAARLFFFLGFFFFCVAFMPFLPPQFANVRTRMTSFLRPTALALPHSSAPLIIVASSHPQRICLWLRAPPSAVTHRCLRCRCLLPFDTSP